MYGYYTGIIKALTQYNYGEYRKQESITRVAKVYSGSRILWQAILAVVGWHGLPVGLPKQNMSFFAFAPTVGYW